jgi:hypothetical protein
MIPKVQIKDSKDDVVFYGFKNSALLKQCLAKQCALLQSDSAVPANELNAGFKLIISFCIEMWRLEKRFKKLHDEQPDLDLSAFFDQMERIRDLFIRDGIVVKDYLDEGYKEGISLQVLHFEDDPTLPPGYAKIVETVRPTIFYNDKVIFHGEVVVAKSTQK